MLMFWILVVVACLCPVAIIWGFALENYTVPPIAFIILCLCLLCVLYICFSTDKKNNDITDCRCNCGCVLSDSYRI